MAVCIIQHFNAEFVVLNAKFLVFNTEFLGFNTEFLGFNTEFLVFNTEFLGFNRVYHLYSPQRSIVPGPSSFAEPEPGRPKSYIFSREES